MGGRGPTIRALLSSPGPMRSQVGRDRRFDAGRDLAGLRRRLAERSAKLLMTDDAAQELLGGDLDVDDLDLSRGHPGGEEVAEPGVGDRWAPLEHDPSQLGEPTELPGGELPLHRHPWMTWEVVVEGRIRALVGDDTYEVGPGDLLFTPPDVPPTFMAIGDGEAAIVGINWPGGFHHLYAELAPLFHVGGPPDAAAMAAAAANHGAEILGPPLAQLEVAGG